MILTKTRTLRQIQEKQFFLDNYRKKKPSIRALIDYLKILYENDGPTEQEYKPLNDALNYYRANTPDTTWKRAGKKVAKIFGKDYVHSIAGHAFLKPHGYAGDFEIIDKMYLKNISKVPKLIKWDLFYHQHAAAKAVRNRKTFFKRILARKVQNATRVCEVLNVASGPCRDVQEFFQEHYCKNLHFDCVESDLNAILHATKINYKNLPQITFYNKNIFRFQTEKKYNFIWSAGLFDYFDDKTFVRLLNRLSQYIKPEGELIIGNFAVGNPTEGYMELFTDWYLYHRSEEQLVTLAQEAGIQNLSRIKVDQEAEGVNLFLRIKF